MSIIAVKKYDDRIEIAADTIELRSDLIDKFPKLYKNDKKEFYVGTTGDARYCEYFLQYSKIYAPKENNYFSILDFANDCISEMSDVFGTDPSKIFEEFDAVMVFYDKIWVLSYGLKEITDYYAIGAAEKEVSTLLYIGKTPKEAIEIACNLNNDICKPITEFVIKTKYI